MQAATRLLYRHRQGVDTPSVCGIAGLVARGPDPTLGATAAAMADTMRHRGPDDAGLWSSSDHLAAFGFRRLSIIDLAGGHQPMANEDSSLWLIFNGEIYNFVELRRELVERGHTFATRSDAEVILHLYEEDGPDCLAGLRGMFAFAIWDQRRRRLFAARDRLGIKPFYWTSVNGTFAFASEIRAFAAVPNWRVELDEEALHHYLTFLATPAPMTLFAGTRKLPAGHFLMLESGGSPSVSEYWDPAAPRDERLSAGECVERVADLIDDAVASHMISDVPFGAFLSGGVDSTTNVALMGRHMTEPPRTFSVGFASGGRYSELAEARAVARHYQTDHHEVEIGLDEALAFLPDLIELQDEPLADPVCLPLHFVARLMRQDGVAVGHVGEGADEIFFGYPNYVRARRDARWLGGLSSAPAWATAIGRGVVAGLSDVTGRGAGVVSALDRLRRGEALFWGGAIAFDEGQKARILTDDFRARRRGLSSHDIVAAIQQRLIERRPDADAVDLICYQDLKVRLPELLLMRVDKMTMANSIEARVPFLDHRLVEFVLSIPGTQRANGGPKHLLKKAVRSIVPAEVIARPKRGFDAPTAAWFRGPLGDRLRRLGRTSGFAERGIVDPSAIDGLIDAHRSGRADHSVRLWTVLNLILWHERWIVRRAIGDVIHSE